MARQPIDSEALEDRIAEQVTPPDVPSPRRPRLSRRARAWLAGGLVGLVTAGSIGFVLLRSTTATTASTYRTVTVARDTLKQTVSASGTIQPARRADLTFTSAGEVTSVQVEVGDTVRAGDVLATIDDSALEISCESARAELTAARETLADLVDSDASDAAIAAARATVKVKRNAVTQAQDALEAAVLAAPFGGVIADIGFADGDTVGSASSANGGASQTAGGSGSSGITLISKGTFTVDTSVSNADVTSIKKGLQATITPTGSDTAVFGTVTSVGVVASTSSNSSGSATFPVQIRITGRHPDLLAGSSASAQITVAHLSDVLSVPTQAISSVDGQTVVQRLVDGQKMQTAVTIQEVIGSSTVVTEGLAEGDQVVVANFRAAESTSQTGQSQNTQSFPGGGGAPPDMGTLPGGAGGQAGNR